MNQTPTIDSDFFFLLLSMMSMNNISQASAPLQRFISEQSTNPMTLVAPLNTTGDEESVPDDQPSVSSPIIDSQLKSTTLTQPENQDSTLQSIPSASSPSSSFLTATQPSTTDPSTISNEPQQMTSSPNHEHEPIPFEPCRTSPQPDESGLAPTIQSNIVDELEQ